jgi:hypothetical protein
MSAFIQSVIFLFTLQFVEAKKVDNVIKSATAKICPTTMFGKKSFLLTNQNVKRHQQKALSDLKLILENLCLQV